MGLAALICAAYMSLGLANAEVACENMEHVVQSSAEHGVPAELMVALIYTESRWEPTARSRAGACGLTQVMPRYTGGRATGGIKYTCQQLIDDPALSIRVGAQIYSFWLRSYAGCRQRNGVACTRRQHRVALCGYNAGYRCKGNNPNRHGMYYARTVLRRRNAIERNVEHELGCGN